MEYANYNDTIGKGIHGLEQWMLGKRVIEKKTRQILVASLTTDGIETTYDMVFRSLYKYMLRRENINDVENIETITYKWRPLGNPGDYYLFPLWLGGKLVLSWDRVSIQFDERVEERDRQCAEILFDSKLYEYLIENIPSKRNTVVVDNNRLKENDTEPLADALGLAILEYSGNKTPENIRQSYLAREGGYTNDKFLNDLIPRLGNDIKLEEEKNQFSVGDQVQYYSKTQKQPEDGEVNSISKDGSVNILLSSGYVRMNADPRNIKYPSLELDGSTPVPGIANADGPVSGVLRVAGGAINKRRKTNKRKIIRQQINKRKSNRRKNSKRKRNKKRTNKRNTNKRRN